MTSRFQQWCLIHLRTTHLPSPSLDFLHEVYLRASKQKKASENSKQIKTKKQPFSANKRDPQITQPCLQDESRMVSLHPRRVPQPGSWPPAPASPGPRRPATWLFHRLRHSTSSEQMLSVHVVYPPLAPSALGEKSRLLLGRAGTPGRSPPPGPPD